MESHSVSSAEEGCSRSAPLPGGVCLCRPVPKHPASEPSEPTAPLLLDVTKGVVSGWPGRLASPFMSPVSQTKLEGWRKEQVSEEFPSWLSGNRTQLSIHEDAGLIPGFT